MDWESKLEDWCEKYQPIQNHFTQTGDDKFETYGEELDFVRAQDPRCIWTLVDGDDGNLYITSGYHLVNRINYFVTEVPFEGEYHEVPYCIFDESEDLPRFVVRNHNATVLGYFDTRADANKEAIFYSAQTGNPAYVEDTQNV